jgi:F-type H+-transporting ATPase subunit delta
MRPSRRKIAEIIARRLERGESMNKLSKEVAAYLLDAKRSSELESIMRDVIALRADNGHVESSLTTAHKLSPKLEKEIKDLVKVIRPSTKTIQLNEEVEPDLIGGFKLNVINQSLDLSVRAQLNRLKQLSTQGGT